jgi:hypothetical protein
VYKFCGISCNSRKTVHRFLGEIPVLQCMIMYINMYMNMNMYIYKFLHVHMYKDIKIDGHVHEHVPKVDQHSSVACQYCQ